MFLSTARLTPFLEAAAGDHERAVELYRWNMRVAGALHTQISYVEVAFRNSLDQVLRRWNAKQSRADGSLYGPFWTTEGSAAEPLYTLLKADIDKARRDAAREAKRRHEEHPRFNATPVHDDIVAQLTFGAWTKLLTNHHHDGLIDGFWRSTLHEAFPNLNDGKNARPRQSSLADAVRRLRNRAAHHDNLLSVAIGQRLRDMLRLLHSLDADFPAWAMQGSHLRRIAQEDPRRRWLEDAQVIAAAA